MTGDQRLRILAAALWAVFALILWNVLFDYGVRMAASRYLAERSAFLRGHGPRVELSSAMRDGITQARDVATALASPCLIVAVALAAKARRAKK